MSNDIIQKPDQAMVDVQAEFADVGGTGFENVKASDLLIPRLTILQGLSPQVIKGKPEYDPNARVGDIYDVGLQERFPEGIEIVAAHYNKVWLEWPPRGSGKRVVIHPTEAIMDQVDEENMLENGNVVAETAQFFVINLTAAERRKSFVPMSITQLKKAKRLLTLAQSERIMLNGEEKMPPLFWRSYFLTTVPEQNAKGSWMGWKIERGPQLIERKDYKILLSEIKFLREAVLEGRAHGDLGEDEASASEKAF